MAVDRARYRRVIFQGARILQARELNTQQYIDANEDFTVTGAYSPTAYKLGALYREGATLNVALSISGTSVTLVPIDNTRPMLVFVRGIWEKFENSEVPSVSLGSSGTNVYLNWSLQIMTVSDDAQLVDVSTGETVAQMAQLILSVSATDTSGVTLASNQAEKNIAPIILFSFTNSGTALTLVPIDNVLAQAKATANEGGLVTLSTGTSGGVACSNDDARLSNARQPAVGSVVDASVRTPVAPGGTNADGTTIYSLASDAGGISARKIILNATTQLLEDGWAWLKGVVTTVAAALTAHIGARLGLSNTHPMPTATDVGAAPLSHVGAALGTPATHPLAVSQNTAGFVINRNPAVAAIPNDYGFVVTEGTTPRSGLTHQGDVYAALANAFTVAGSDGDGPRAHTGNLGLLSLVAAILSDHVNKVSHNNPHGLTPADLGAATTGYVDSGDANTLATALAYSDLIGSISVRKVPTLANTTQGVWPSGVGPGEPGLRSLINTNFIWLIVTFGNKFELGFGMGTLANGASIPYPPADGNGSWSAVNSIGVASLASGLDKYDLDSPSWADDFSMMGVAPDTTNAGWFPTGPTGFWVSQFGGYSLYSGCTVIAWRFIQPPPVLISLNPPHGSAGDPITILGRNFGSIAGNVSVLMNGSTAPVVSCNPTQLVVTVPTGIASGAGSVSVTVSGKAGVNTLTFILI